MYPETYQGHFGPFTIDGADRREVIIYRLGLGIAALCFALGVILISTMPDQILWLTPLYAGFCVALGVSLMTIHIYLAVLHRFLQVCWGLGCLATLALAYGNPDPLALTLYTHPITLFGVGFTFVALTGIYFKEAFCFNRLETKLLTPLVPGLLLGHLCGILSLEWEWILLMTWALLFSIFALRKMSQPIASDIGDKSVFAHLRGEL